MRLPRRILLWLRTLFSPAHSPARRTVCTLRCCFRAPNKSGSRAAFKRTSDPLAEAQHFYTSRNSRGCMIALFRRYPFWYIKNRSRAFASIELIFRNLDLSLIRFAVVVLNGRLNQYNPRGSTSGVPASSSGQITGYPLEEAQAASLTN